MQFAYDTYYKINFVLPARTVIFCVIVIVITAFTFIKSFKDRDYNDLKSFLLEN
jgi:hypothetical protein